jgi:hypothetical protein
MIKQAYYALCDYCQLGVIGHGLISASRFTTREEAATALEEAIVKGTVFTDPENPARHYHKNCHEQNECGKKGHNLRTQVVSSYDKSVEHYCPTCGYMRHVNIDINDPNHPVHQCRKNGHLPTGWYIYGEGENPRTYRAERFCERCAEPEQLTINAALIREPIAKLIDITVEGETTTLTDTNGNPLGAWRLDTETTP